MRDVRRRRSYGSRAYYESHHSYRAACRYAGVTRSACAIAQAVMLRLVYSGTLRRGVPHSETGRTTRSLIDGKLTLVPEWTGKS